MSAQVWSVPMRTRFRGIDVRDGVLVRGPAGWGEFSPFWDYDDAESRRWWAAGGRAGGGEFSPFWDCADAESRRWWAAAVESAVEGWPAPRRSAVPVNVTDR